MLYFCISEVVSISDTEQEDLRAAIAASLQGSCNNCENVEDVELSVTRYTTIPCPGHFKP